MVRFHLGLFVGPTLDETSGTAAYWCASGSVAAAIPSGDVCLTSSSPSNEKNVGSSQECCFKFRSARLGDEAAVALTFLAHTHTNIKKQPKPVKTKESFGPSNRARHDCSYVGIHPVCVHVFLMNELSNGRAPGARALW